MKDLVHWFLELPPGKHVAISAFLSSLPLAIGAVRWFCKRERKPKKPETREQIDKRKRKERLASMGKRRLPEPGAPAHRTGSPRAAPPPPPRPRPGSLQCDKTFTDCKRHGNAHRYGGAFPLRETRCPFVFGDTACKGSKQAPKQEQDSKARAEKLLGVHGMDAAQFASFAAAARASSASVEEMAKAAGSMFNNFPPIVPLTYTGKKPPPHRRNHV